MTEGIRKLCALVRQYGWRRCLFRMFHEQKRKHGILKWKFPTWHWEERTLSYWVVGKTPTEPEEYRSFRDNCATEFFFPLGQPPKPRPEWVSGDIHTAEMLLEGKMWYFSNQIGQVGYPDANWYRNPFTGQQASAGQHWCDRGDFDASVGDIKYIWEPSRFGWAYALSRAYAAAKDDRYAEAFWRLLESWMSANSPNTGPNWQCGQETAIRSMACTFALHVFWNSPATTAQRVARLVTLLAGSAERIAANINFARAQMGNHASSEAAGLYTIGILFPELGKAKRWRELGRFVLEDEACQHNWADGSYVQHSMNYQRMTLHNCLWSLRLGELNGESFSGLTVDRLKKSYEFLYQLQDGDTGKVPNYGSNDGALIMPLNGCDYLDYRPIVGAMHYLFTHSRLYEDGPWSEDLLWLFGSKERDASPSPLVRKSAAFTTGGYYTLRGDSSWGMIRCHSYSNRPSQADILHLDLWWRGVNILRDSGTFTYFDPESRWDLYFTSTSAHNTVVVGNAEQMIKGPRFRWFSLVKSRFVSHVRNGNVELWQGEHYGYKRLSCKATHSRTVCRIGEEYWLIVDDILGQGSEDVRLFWHLADFTCQIQDKTVRLNVNGDEACLFVDSSSREMDIRLERGLNSEQRMGWQSLYYGERTAAPTVCASADNALPVRFVTLVSLGKPCTITESSPDSAIAWSEQGQNAGRVELAPPGSEDEVIRAVWSCRQDEWRPSCLGSQDRRS